MSVNNNHIMDLRRLYDSVGKRTTEHYLGCKTDDAAKGGHGRKCPHKGGVSDVIERKLKCDNYLEPKATVAICRESKRLKVYDMTNSPYIWGDECKAESQYSAVINKMTTNSLVKSYTVEVYDYLDQLQCSVLSICGDVKIVYTNGYIVIKDDKCVSIFSLANKMVRMIDVSDVIYVGRGFFGYKKDGKVYLTLIGNTSFEDGKGIEASGMELNGLYQTHIGIPYANPTDKPWIIVEFGGKVYAVSADKNDCLDYVNLSDYNIKENGPIVKVGMGSVTKADDKKSDDVDDERLGNAIADIISKLPDNEHFVKKLCDDDTERNEPIGKYKVHIFDNDTTPKISTQVEETLNLYGKFISQLWQEVYGLPLEY